MLSGQIAQLVEHPPEKWKVASSILALATAKAPEDRAVFGGLVVRRARGRGSGPRRGGRRGASLAAMSENTATNENTAGEPVVEHRADESTYIIRLGDKVVGHADYEARGDGVKDFNHTVVDPEYRGRGLAGRLIEFALDDVAERGEKIIPTCSAVAGFIEKNPSYAKLVAS